jgi:hypothetical protein
MQARPAPPPRAYDTLAGVLSYLVPGLGQIYQGRVGKGVLFLVAIYILFFYGLYLGTSTVQASERSVTVSTAVYLPDVVEDSGKAGPLPTLAANLYNRPQFLGQFWVGVAAWPALLQYARYDRAANLELDQKIDRLYQDASDAAHNNKPDEARHYRQEAEGLERDPARNLPLVGQFQREPPGGVLAIVHNAGDKRLELGWVFTVIAGVLNIMVIYDALAGPAFLLSAGEPHKGES